MMIKLSIITLLLLIAGVSTADVIVQQKQCHRVWNTSDTITSTMSDSSWVSWKKDNEQCIHNKDVRYVSVVNNERFSTVKDYDWITLEKH